MKTIQVNYDLKKPGRNYEPLYDYLRSYKTRSRPLQSLWLIKSNKSVSTVRDELKQRVDSNDQVLVVDVTGDAWATNFSNASTDWMKKNMRGSSTTTLRRAA